MNTADRPASRLPFSAVVVLLLLTHGSLATEIGVRQERFLLDGKPTFLLGISYYAGLGASEETLARDLDEMKRHGFNWLRVWATWAGFDNDISAIDRDGRARPEFIARLKSLLAEADKRGMIVNVTLSRGNGITGPERLQGPDPHRGAVETLVRELKDHPNWYLDLSNERNIKDKRFTSIEELAAMLNAARAIDPKRLITASHAGDASKEDVAAYVKTVGVDFISIHRPREEGSAAQTEARTKEYLAWMKDAGKVVPVHYDEPFRRGWGKWQPAADDFMADLTAAEKSGAAGWCFHNGDQRDARESRPRRSFDLREKRLFEQLDDQERKFLAQLLRRRQGGN